MFSKLAFHKPEFARLHLYWPHVDDNGNINIAEANRIGDILDIIKQGIEENAEATSNADDWTTNELVNDGRYGQTPFFNYSAKELIIFKEGRFAFLQNLRNEELISMRRASPYTDLYLHDLPAHVLIWLYRQHAIMKGFKEWVKMWSTDLEQYRNWPRLDSGWKFTFDRPLAITIEAAAKLGSTSVIQVLCLQDYVLLLQIRYHLRNDDRPLHRMPIHTVLSAADHCKNSTSFQIAQEFNAELQLYAAYVEEHRLTTVFNYQSNEKEKGEQRSGVILSAPIYRPQSEMTTAYAAKVKEMSLFYDGNLTFLASLDRDELISMRQSCWFTEVRLQELHPSLLLKLYREHSKLPKQADWLPLWSSDLQMMEDGEKFKSKVHFGFTRPQTASSFEEVASGGVVEAIKYICLYEFSSLLQMRCYLADDPRPLYEMSLVTIVSARKESKTKCGAHGIVKFFEAELQFYLMYIASQDSPHAGPNGASLSSETKSSLHEGQAAFLQYVAKHNPLSLLRMRLLLSDHDFPLSTMSCGKLWAVWCNSLLLNPVFGICSMESFRMHPDWDESYLGEVSEIGLECKCFLLFGQNDSEDSDYEESIGFESMNDDFDLNSPIDFPDF